MDRRLFMGLLAAAAAGAPAQARFPERPITLLVPFGPGGIADITARAVAEQMARTLGHPVVVENRPSAGSIVASQAVATARPDGHTLLLMSNGNAVSVGLFRRLPYDTLKDFAPVSLLGSFDLGLSVPAGSRFATLADLLAYSKANPGRLNVGTIGVGSTQHLAAKLFETVAGVQTLVVPYKGSPAVQAALRTGEIDLAFEIVGPMLPQVLSAAVRALAVSSAQRNPALPAVPTVQQAGVAGYDVASWNALAAPAGTPPAVIEARPPRRARRGGRACGAGATGPPGHATGGQLAGRAAGAAGQRGRALGRGDPRRWHRAGVSERSPAPAAGLASSPLNQAGLPSQCPAM
jgi:tripartite-type tricarboxylate transporter receptor subunit TctC